MKYTIPKITDLTPSTPLDDPEIKLLSNFQLADSTHSQIKSR